MIKNFLKKRPYIEESCFIAENASIIGDVKIGQNSSVWFGSVIRAELNSISIGKNTNIQDNSTLHEDKDAPLIIGDNVTVGHNVILHGCNIENNVLIGMGSIILNNAKIGEQTIIGAGSLVTEGKEIPSGVLCLGSPAKVIRNLTEEEISRIKISADHYRELASEYK